jgi:hypothetical protein
MRSWKAEDRLIFHKKYIISELTYRGQFYAGVSFLLVHITKVEVTSHAANGFKGESPVLTRMAGAAVNFSLLLHLFSIYSLWLRLYMRVTFVTYNYEFIALVIEEV